MVYGYCTYFPFPDNSDFSTIHNAFASWRRASANGGYVRKFCKQNFLSHQVGARPTNTFFDRRLDQRRQNLQQIEELRQQFLG